MSTSTRKSTRSSSKAMQAPVVQASKPKKRLAPETPLVALAAKKSKTKDVAPTQKAFSSTKAPTRKAPVEIPDTSSSSEGGDEDDEEEEEHESDSDLRQMDTTMLRKTMAAERIQWGSKPAQKSSRRRASSNHSEEDEEEEGVRSDATPPPPSDLIEDDGDGDGDELALEVSQTRKGKARRTADRLAEVPQWQSLPVASSGNAIEISDDSDEPDSDASEPVTASVATGCPKCNHVKARYTLPGQGARIIALCAQPPDVYRLIDATLTVVIGDSIFDDAYPPSVMINNYYRRKLLEAAQELDLPHLHHRVAHDPSFVIHVGRVLSARVSNVRCGIKKIVISKIKPGYQLAGTVTEIKEQVAKLVASSRYIFPSATTDGQGLLRRTKPFFHQVITGSISEYYFASSRTLSLGERYCSRFESSISTLANEIELPAAMVALAATAVYASLQDWSDGTLKKTEFNTDAFLDIYRSHIIFLSGIRENNANAYHRLMHDLYKDVCAINSCTAEEHAAAAAAVLDMDAMDI